MKPITAHEKTFAGHRLSCGHLLPFGVSHVPGGVNFSIFSANATGCTLVLFERGTDKPIAEIPFPLEFRLGHVWAMVVHDLPYEELEYGFRMQGPWSPREGHYFDASKILLDPHAREIVGRETWMRKPDASKKPIYRSRIPGGSELPSPNDFPHVRDSDLIIYEMHLRGFTRNPNSEVKAPGTYAGLAEKADYLKDLGVNCVELMPVFEFDETENPRTNPTTGDILSNYWGYSTVGFFAPKSSYAVKAAEGLQVKEMKDMIHALHLNGIEIMLDVVFNHTAEGGADGPVFSFRGIDNKTWYILDEKGVFANYSGCGNTVNCNYPAVREFVINCLRYWAAEYHVDGFRFDLASILGRDSNGCPLTNPPLLEFLAHDPVLADCKLVAEAWDAGGLYQVGNFPSYGRWMEWNGKYRDCVRKFLKGDPGMVGEMVQRIMGSPDLYAPARRKATASVNFITCHDGFTLRDLVHKIGGRRVARTVIVATAGLNVLLALGLWATAVLPGDPSVTTPAQEWFGPVLTPVLRITLGSIVAQVIAEMIDTEVYHRYVRRFGHRAQWGRVLASNAVSIPVDSVVFVAIAFGGVLPLSVAVSVVWANVVVKGLASVLTTPLIFAVPEDLTRPPAD